MKFKFFFVFAILLSASSVLRSDASTVKDQIQTLASELLRKLPQTTSTEEELIELDEDQIAVN